MSRIGFIVTYDELVEKVKGIVKTSTDVEVRVGLLSGAIDVEKELIKVGTEVFVSRGELKSIL